MKDRLNLNPRSKTLWLQGLLALAVLLWPEHIAELCRVTSESSVRNVVLMQCALTVVAYVVRLRKPGTDKPET